MAIRVELVDHHPVEVCIVTHLLGQHSAGSTQANGIMQAFDRLADQQEMLINTGLPRPVDCIDAPAVFQFQDQQIIVPMDQTIKEIGFPFDGDRDREAIALILFGCEQRLGELFAFVGGEEQSDRLVE